MISVNGVDLTNLTTQQVTSILQQAPDNVTMVMSWGTATNTPTKLADHGCGVGMQFRVALERGGSGFGFSTRNTYMGNESFIRIKTVVPGGPAATNGS